MAKLTGSTRIIEALNKYGIFTFEDVIFHLPRTYLNLTYRDDFKINSNEKVTLFLRALEKPIVIRTNKVIIIRFNAISMQNTPYTLVAFNQAHIARIIDVGTMFTVYGSVSLRNREISVIKIFPRRLNDYELMQPVYTLPSDVANHEFARIVKKALAHSNLTSLVPSRIRQNKELVSLNNAVSYVHNPRSMRDVFEGLKALKYEEGLPYFTKLLHYRRLNSVLRNTQKSIIDLKKANEFIKKLPFSLTKEQTKAIREIGYDMNKETLMYRLLQGDVGSGKTVVSFAALYINFLRGAQGVLLAPTDSLAKQHYESLKALFKDFPIRIEPLVGSMKETSKKALKEAISRHNVDIIVGTHAVFSEDVSYKRLELVVIDEQHKFGVNQRQTLVNKGEKADLLLLSATPIPQTLANIIYSDMDITTIESFPHKGREVVTTLVHSNDKLISTLIDETLQNRRQIYIIAPKIAFGDKLNVHELSAVYQKKYGSLVGVLHGQMSAEEKDMGLASFKSGVTPILIATSVVEVGIDVKNAGLMIIYEPTSFGLSSLHQLRGRIGRDGKKANLLLVSDDADNEKLVAFCNENDGFKIAELDLELRGPGELTGEKQSGFTRFMYLNVIKDQKLIQKIKKDATEILDNPFDEENRKFLAKILVD